MRGTPEVEVSLRRRASLRSRVPLGTSDEQPARQRLPFEIKNYGRKNSFEKKFINFLEAHPPLFAIIRMTLGATPFLNRYSIADLQTK